MPRLPSADFRPCDAVVIGEIARELAQLGHLLGRVYDLTFLADRLRRERNESHWGTQDDALLATIESSEAELQRDSIQIAQRFFREHASDFAAHIDRWFEDWPLTRPDSPAKALLAA